MSTNSEDVQKIVNNWIRCAEEDLELARRELNYIDQEILIRIVCFHCQQAIEKYFKAFLIANHCNFRKTHDLDELKTLCMQFDKNLELLEVSHLSLYAVDTRYPDYFLVPSLEDAKNSWKLANLVRETILVKIQR
jgi:HEPN domain-containing protein